MDFTFTVRVASITKIMTIEVSVDKERIGTLHMQEDEWDALRPMLVHGATYFMDNEAKIAIKDVRSSLPAYLEGVDG